jgi:hypothetical protein
MNSFAIHEENRSLSRPQSAGFAYGAPPYPYPHVHYFSPPPPPPATAPYVPAPPQAPSANGMINYNSSSQFYSPYPHQMAGMFNYFFKAHLLHHNENSGRFL